MHDQGQPVSLEQVEVEKDLGIYFDSKLSFREHITKKVNIANRNLGCIFRSFTYMKKDQIMLENVQRRATRFVKALQGKTYSERLKSLGLPSLQYRPLRNDMVQTYKIVRDIDIVDKDKLLTIATETRTRGHKYKSFQRRSRLNIRKNVFSNRVVNTWNNLPSSVVEAPSVNSFKSRLNRHWTNHPSKFNPPCYITHATGQIAR